MEFMDSDEEFFLTQNCFSQEVLEPNFSIGCTIGEIGNDLESDPQNSLHKDFKEILFEEKNKEGQTDPRKTSADRRMIAIVDIKELEKRKGRRNFMSTETAKLNIAINCNENFYEN